MPLLTDEIDAITEIMAATVVMKSNRSSSSGESHEKEGASPDLTRWFSASARGNRHQGNTINVDLSKGWELFQ